MRILKSNNNKNFLISEATSKDVDLIVNTIVYRENLKKEEFEYLCDSVLNFIGTKEIFSMPIWFPYSTKHRGAVCFPFKGSFVVRVYESVEDLYEITQLLCT